MKTWLKSAKKLVFQQFEDTVPAKSMFTPIISGDRGLGFISIDNFERENAFGEAEVRLLNEPSPPTEAAKSLVAVPMVVGGQVKGFVDLQDVEKEHAFSDSDIRLLTTITNAIRLPF